MNNGTCWIEKERKVEAKVLRPKLNICGLLVSFDQKTILTLDRHPQSPRYSVEEQESLVENGDNGLFAVNNTQRIQNESRDLWWVNILKSKVIRSIVHIAIDQGGVYP